MNGLGLGGLASGMDTETLIQKILTYENRKIINQQMKKAQVEAKQDAWKQVRSSLQGLRSALDSIRLSSTFAARAATLSDATVASVTVTSGATNTTHSLAVRQLATYHVVAGSNVTSANDPIGYAGTYPATLTINGKGITVESGETLNSLRDKINGTTDVGVKAEVVKVPVGADIKYRLVLTSSTQGATGAMTVTDDTGTDALAKSLGLVAADGTLNELSVAQDADFTLNGVDYTSASNSITDILPGVSISLKKSGTVNPDATITPASTSITIDRDLDKTAAAVENWVKGFNATIDLMKEATSYDADSKKKGLLNGEELARSILFNLRGMISRTVSGLPSTLNRLSQVGITSGAFGTADYGKVVLDKAKLKEMLTSDEQGVAKLFGAVQNNVALSSAGATIDTANTDAIAASSTYDPANVLNGDASSDRFGSVGGGWESPQAPSIAPQKLTIDLNGSKTIEQIRLYQPDNDTYSASSTGLQNFTVEYLGTDGQWHVIEQVTNHSGALKTLSFDPVTATKVRVTVTATYSDAPARLTEVEVNERNDGTAATMFRYLEQTLFKSVTGSLDSRSEALQGQVKAIGQQIDRLSEQMTKREAQLRQQFSRMEQAMAKLQSQSGYIAMMGQMLTGNSGQKA